MSECFEQTLLQWALLTYAHAAIGVNIIICMAKVWVHLISGSRCVRFYLSLQMSINIDV